MELLSFKEQEKLLAEYKIPQCPSFLAESKSRAFSAAGKTGYPLVLKISSPDIFHKTDIGGIETGVKNKKELSSSYNKIISSVKKEKPKARIEGVLVQKEIKGTELIFGMKRDSQFGPVLMAGLGGVFVEVLKDVSLRIAPFTEKEAIQMMKELKAWPIFKGYRNYPALKTDLLAKILCKLSRLSMERKEIKEIDFNPVIANQKEALVADSKMLI